MPKVNHSQLATSGFSRKKKSPNLINSIPSDSSTGYILECDLSYPPELHDLHADYPMAPEHLEITEDMLSPYSKSLIDPLHPAILQKTRPKSHE